MTDTQQATPTPGDDEIDLLGLFRVLWAGKWLIGGITLASAVIAVVVALMLPNIYRAEALLAPNDQNRAGGLSALADQYGGLASLAGIDFGAKKRDKTDLGMEIMKSRKFLMRFIEDHDLLVPLMAADGWSSDTREIRVDPKLYDTSSREWVRKVKPPLGKVPSFLEAYKRFIRIFSVTQNKETGFISVTVEHYSPYLAKQWVDWLVADVNDWVMKKDVEEAKHAIDYLHKQVETTSLSGLQNVFFGLIEEQTKTVLLAEVSDEYLFKTIDPAVVPEKRSRPRRLLITLFITILGAFFSVVLVLILHRKEY